MKNKNESFHFGVGALSASVCGLIGYLTNQIGWIAASVTVSIFFILSGKFALSKENVGGKNE